MPPPAERGSALLALPENQWFDRKSNRISPREPRFADSAFNLGMVSRQSLGELVAALPERFVPDRCAQCMPSSRTGNGVYHKLVADLRDGVGLTEQPFAPDVTISR